MEEVKGNIMDDQLWSHAKGLVAVGKPLCDLLDLTNSSVRVPLFLHFAHMFANMHRYQLASRPKFWIVLHPRDTDLKR